MGCCCSSVEDVALPLSDLRWTDGPPVDHVLMNFPVNMRYSKSGGGRHVKQWTNSDEYQPQVTEYYKKGFRMLEFLLIPGQRKRAGCRTIKLEYQAIFYKNQTEDEQYDLVVRQSSLSFNCQYSGILGREMKASGDMSDMFNVISQEAAKGSRYLGMAHSGMDVKVEGFQSPVARGGAIVTLLFEAPRHVKEAYVYDIVKAPISITMNAVCCGARQTCDGDFTEIVYSHLAQGWRLITAFMDLTSVAYQRRMRSAGAQLNCLWIFEKPVSRTHSYTPAYQAHIIEFQYKIKGVCCGTKAVTLWNATVEEMGKRGWSLASIVPVPDSVVKKCPLGSTTKVLLIFQRPCEM